MRSVVLLSRRHRLYGAAADWNLPEVELFLFDSPSEALARIAVGNTAVFLFDTRDYPRYRDGLGLKFRMTTIDVARSLDLPKRLRIVAQSQLVKEEGP